MRQAHVVMERRETHSWLIARAGSAQGRVLYLSTLPTRRLRVGLTSSIVLRTVRLATVAFPA